MSAPIVIKLLAVLLAGFFAFRKTRNDFIVANKRVSHEKKAALQRAQKDGIRNAFLIVVLGLLLFASEILDTSKKEASAVARHQDLRTNLLTSEQVEQIVRNELRNAAQSQQTIRSEEFQRKYPSGYTLFSVAGTFVSEEMRNWDTNFFKADWNTASIRSLTTETVEFVPPAFRVGTGALKLDGGMSFSGGESNFQINFGGGTGTSLPRKAGATMGWATIGLGINKDLNISTNLKVSLEVATNNPMGVTMVVGTRTLLEPIGKSTGRYFFRLRPQ